MPPGFLPCGRILAMSNWVETQADPEHAGRIILFIPSGLGMLQDNRGVGGWGLKRRMSELLCLGLGYARKFKHGETAYIFRQ